MTDDAVRAWKDLLHAIKTWSETEDLDQHAGFRLETQYGPVYVSIGRSYDHANVDEDVAHPLVREQPLTTGDCPEAENHRRLLVGEGEDAHYECYYCEARLP